MDPVQGQDCIVKVEDPATPGTFVAVENANTVSKSKTRPVTTERVFGKAVPLRAEGTPDEPYTIGGFLTPGDPGQKILNDAELARTVVNIKVQPDGTNGWTQKVFVHSYKYDAKPDGYQPISWDMTAVAPAVLVGTPPVAPAVLTMPL